MNTNDGGNATDDDVDPLSRPQRPQVGQRHYDPDQETDLTTAIVFAIADVMGISPHEVPAPPMYECIDAPALEAAFFGTKEDSLSRQGSGSIEFDFAGYVVTITSDGWIRIYELSLD